MVFWGFGFITLALLATSNKNIPVTKPVVKNNLPITTKPVAIVEREEIALKKDAGSTALAVVKTHDYEITIYGAFAFSPDDFNSAFIKTDSGHHFVVLDISVQNMTKKRTVDIGQILLSAIVTDETGNVYPRNALAVEAFEMQYPEQSHQAEYKAMKGKIKPGMYHRTTAYGFEAPDNIKNFVMTLTETDKFEKDSKMRSVAFAIE